MQTSFFSQVLLSIFEETKTISSPSFLRHIYSRAFIASESVGFHPIALSSCAMPISDGTKTGQKLQKSNPTICYAKATISNNSLSGCKGTVLSRNKQENRHKS